MNMTTIVYLSQYYVNWLTGDSYLKTEQYNAQNLRLQTVAFMAKNYEFMYTKVMHTITGSFI